MNDPVIREAGIQMFAEACPDESQKTWDLLRTSLDEGFRSIDRRLEESGPLHPERFDLQEANARLSEWTLRGAHLLLQTRTKVLNEELDDAFRRWYPNFRLQPQRQTAADQKAA